MSIAMALRASPAELESKVTQLLEQQKKSERDLASLKSKLTSGHRGDLAESAVHVRGVQVVATAIEGADAQSLREGAAARTSPRPAAPTPRNSKRRLRPSSRLSPASSEEPDPITAGRRHQC
jgi:alanyl-tRNA synthetase